MVSRKLLLLNAPKLFKVPTYKQCKELIRAGLKQVEDDSWIFWLKDFNKRHKIEDDELMFIELGE